MRILIITVITALGLPLMALGQQAEPEQTQGQDDQGHADYCAGEREEDESPGGAGQTAGKTWNRHKRTWTDER